jgi:hypothetical protein
MAAAQDAGWRTALVQSNGDEPGSHGSGQRPWMWDMEARSLPKLVEMLVSE